MPNGYERKEIPMGVYGDQYHEYGLPLYATGAPHLGHSKHLCNMANRGEDLQIVKNLIKDAKFICKKCGRAAAKEENLCEPVGL